MGAEFRRVAIVAGLRTPFVKQGTALRGWSARALGEQVVAELCRRAQLGGEDVDQLVFGQVMPSLSYHNVARDIVTGAGLSPKIDAYSVSRACATAYQAVASVAQSIRLGETDCGIAGGADSASDVPVGVTTRLRDALLEASKQKTLRGRVRAFARLRPHDLRPVPMALTELSTGRTMGENAEQMAKEHRISREAQDEFAHRSHVRAAAAWEAGRFADQVMTLFVPPGYEPVARDTLVRHDSSLEGYARLKPVFDRSYGTVTAGNASPLTDGAAALVLMSEARARREGREPLGYLGACAFAGMDPAKEPLMGPAYAVPRLLERTGLGLGDFALFDMHEAFAAQVLANVAALESAKFAEEELGRSAAVGQVDWERFNVNGGSLALGHPFAATGARQILQTLHELKRVGGERALCATCAAGGLGAALVLEAA